MADQDNLQFDRAEPVAESGPAKCTACTKPLTSTYYEVNGQVVCETCRRAIDEEWNRGGAAGRMGKAIGLGILATIACSIVWYVVLKLTDSQWGILAVVVGLVVGGAVRKGSNGRGGWRYQALAIFLTYTAIVSSFVPYLIDAMRDQPAQVAQEEAALTPADTPVTADSASGGATGARQVGPLAFVIGVVLLVVLLYAAPFLAGLENIIGILIIGFALYEAWKLNRRTELRITGPYQVASAGANA